MTESRSDAAVVKRLLPAPPAVVFDEWLDASALADFMRPNPNTVVTVSCDPRIGGRLSIVMSTAETVVEINGEYLELDRPRRLKFSWRSSRGGGFESVVEVTLEPAADGQTQMTIHHAMLPPGQMTSHREGWAQIAALVAQRLSRAD